MLFVVVGSIIFCGLGEGFVGFFHEVEVYKEIWVIFINKGVLRVNIGGKLQIHYITQMMGFLVLGLVFGNFVTNLVLFLNIFDNLGIY